MPIARHILAPVQSFRGGGVERVLLRLAGGWIAAGRRVTMIVGSQAGPLAAEVPAGIEIVALGDGRYRALARALPGAVRLARPDVLFIPGNHYTGVAAWTRLRLGDRCPPIVVKVSNALVRRDMGTAAAAAYRVWLRTHPRFADAVVAMSPGMRAEAVAAMGIAPARVKVIANPPAPVTFDATRFAPPPRYLIGVGRLVPQKRWDRAIAALARLAVPVDLVILGEGEERGALQRQAAALGLADRVHLPGYAADPSPVIAGAAALVLTSDYEGVPNVLREALALGTPVVATDSSVAVREIVTGPEQGSVVAVGDEAALVAALERWLAPGVLHPSPRHDAEVASDSAAAYLELFDAL